MSLLVRIPAIDISAIKAKTDNLPASPADEVTVNAIGVVAAAVKAKTDNLPSDPTSETGGLARKFPFLDFWSATSAKITVTSVTGDIGFPDIVVTDLPGGLTIQRALLLFMCRAIKDTSAADNYINAASKTIRIKKAAGAWGTDDVVGITFANQSLYTVASTKEGGLIIVGDADLKSLVNANTTYNIQSNQTNRSDAIVAHSSSLELYDVQVGLRVFFS